MNNDAIGIGCDWGTTTLRAYLLGRDAKILEKIEIPKGIMSVEDGDFQKPIVDTYLKSAKTKGGGLLEIHTGAGKTVMGLKIIAELGVKTIIIVHKEFLLRQWIERMEQFLPEARVGKIQGSIIDKEDQFGFLSIITSPEIYLPISGFFILLIIAFIIKKIYFKTI